MIKPALLRAAEPLTVSVVPGNSIHWVQFVAADKNFYRDAGFEPSIQALQSSAHSIQMAISGNFHVATSQPETFVAAVEQGANQLAALAAPTNQSDWVLTAARDIKSIAELKGRTIGLSGLRASEAWLTSRLLQGHGLGKSDYNFVIAGTSPAKLAALEKNGVGAAVLFEPSASVAKRQGLIPLARYDQLRAYPTILYVVTKEWAAKGDAGQRVSRAIQAAHAWLWDPANRAEALRVLSKYTKQDTAVLEPVYDDYFVKPGLYSKTGAIDRDGLGAVLSDMAEDGAAFTTAPPVEKFVLDPKLGGLIV
jgi:ABC-type nitrate/sulfonate/bicarbonate transport system substrate-binding protein